MELINPRDLDFRALTERGITQETCKRFGYGYAKWNDKACTVAPYYNPKTGELVAQSLRLGKSHKPPFVITGDINRGGLYGQQLWPEGGKRIIVTEGPEDAMIAAQTLGPVKLNWPVVSVPKGAASAAADVKRCLEYLNSFDQVVLCFDNDEPGQDAVEKCAKLFTPGKVHVIRLPLKDCCEMSKAGMGDDLREYLWNRAQPWRPDGVITLKDVKELALKPVLKGVAWPWPKLTEWTYGRRPGELYGFGGGSGAGKTDVFTEVINHTVCELKEPVGVVYLEQPPVETVRRIAGKWASKRFHVEDGSWTIEEFKKAINFLDSEAAPIYLYDHFGSMDWKTIEAKIRYMVVGLGAKHIFLDHLTALSSQADDERRSLDGLMAEMARFAQELQITFYFVSHLATPEGKPHEEGGRVMLKHFRGSRAIGFWSHYLFGLERNQQAKNEADRQLTNFRVIKDRYTGQATGHCFTLEYDHHTGRLNEVSKQWDEPEADPRPWAKKNKGSDGNVPDDFV